MTVKETDIGEFLAGCVRNQRDMDRNVARQMRALVAPTRDAVRNAFDALPGTGPRVAKTVRVAANVRRVTLSFGNAANPYAIGREFGAKRHPYSLESIFGGFTGNQFELGVRGDRIAITKPAGNAFFPTVGEAAAALNGQIVDLLEDQAKELG